MDRGRATLSSFGLVISWAIASGLFIYCMLSFLIFLFTSHLGISILRRDYGNGLLLGEAIGVWLVSVGSAFTPSMLFFANYKFSSVIFGYFALFSGLASIAAFLQERADELPVIAGIFFVVAALFAVCSCITSIIFAKSLKEHARENSLSFLVFVWYAIAACGFGLTVVVFILGVVNYFGGLYVTVILMGFLSFLIPFTLPVLVRQYSLRDGELLKIMVSIFPSFLGWAIAFICRFAYDMYNVLDNAPINYVILATSLLYFVAAFALELYLLIVFRRLRSTEAVEYEALVNNSGKENQNGSGVFVK